MDLKIFDVEHGACALLSTDDGKHLMIDCGHNGATGWRPGNHLIERGIKRLEALVITNYDEDHVSGLPNLADNVHIDWLYRNRTVGAADLKSLKSEDGMGNGIDRLSSMLGTFTQKAGPENPAPTFDRVSFQTFRLPYPEFEDENNLSLVLNITINGLSFLFPGDLEIDGWDALLSRDAKFREAVAGVHILIASHHGRENGKSTRLFDQYGCSPKLVVISDKGYAHDTQETVPYYRSKASGVQINGESRYVLTTRNDGCIQFDFGGRLHGNAGITLNYDLKAELRRGARFI